MRTIAQDILTNPTIHTRIEIESQSVIESRFRDVTTHYFVDGSAIIEDADGYALQPEQIW